MREISSNHSGFSLVELSIVLVILGLLIGGILTGQSLIRAAELRNVMSDIERYRTATYNFRNKYFALPGDMNNATDFWGAADTSGSGGECGDPLTDTGTGTETCNGNGDGQIKGTAENHRAWQHLANAGLIQGTYTGTQGTLGAAHVEPGVNAPAIAMSYGSMMFRYYHNNGLNTYWFPHAGMHAWYLGKATTTTNAYPLYALFYTNEAWKIDTKFDDGKPGYGKIMSLKNTSGYIKKCTTSDDETTAEYNLSYTDVACSLIVSTGF